MFGNGADVSRRPIEDACLYLSAHLGAPRSGGFPERLTELASTDTVVGETGTYQVGVTLHFAAHKEVSGGRDTSVTLIGFLRLLI